MVRKPNLNLRLADLKSLCQFLSSQSIRILGFLEGAFKLLNLFWGKLGPVSSLIRSHVTATNCAAAATVAAAVASAATALASVARGVGAQWIWRQVAQNRLVGNGS